MTVLLPGKMSEEESDIRSMIECGDEIAEELLPVPWIEVKYPPNFDLYSNALFSGPKENSKVIKLERYYCQHCNHQTVNKHSLAVHMNQTHRPVMTFTSGSETERGTDVEETKLQNMKDMNIEVNVCDWCEFKTTKKRRFRRHIRVLHHVDRRQTKKILDRNESRRLKNLHQEKEMSSNLQNMWDVQAELEVFPKIVNCLKEGEEAAATNTPEIMVAKLTALDVMGLHHCKLCPYVTTGVAQMKKHMQSFHSLGSGIDCTLCQQNFVSDKKLKIHARREHGFQYNIRDQYIKCAFCKTRFQSEEDRKSHIDSEHKNADLTKYVVKSPEGNFCCTLCSYVNSQIQGLV